VQLLRGPAPCLLQAQWAGVWLRAHASLAAFQPGWTYMLEAVYRHNAHVVQYNFEGLVLLGAVGPDGRELRPGDPALPRLAQRLGATAAAPCLQGTWGELVSCLEQLPSCTGSASAGGRKAKVGSRPWAVSGPPAFEGWVLVAADGSRHKLVSEQYKRASLAAQGLHPLCVWDAVRCGGLSRQELLAGLPSHFQRELLSILDALARRFCWVQQQLQAQLEAGALLHWAWLDELQQLLGQLEGPLADRAGVLRQAQGMVETVARLAQGSGLQGAGADDAASGLLGSGGFLRALRYALQRGTADAGPMFLSASYASQPGTAPLLRSLVLDCVRPGEDGSLPGYTPSPGFQQTFAKGWARAGPRGSRLPGLLQPPPVLQLADESAMSFLRLLGGKDLVVAQLVCKAWQALLVGDSGYAERARLAREEVEAARRRAREEEREERERRFRAPSYSYDSDDGYYGHSYGGYGSF
jgi:hypothetical protein